MDGQSNANFKECEATAQLLGIEDKGEKSSTKVVCRHGREHDELLCLGR